MDQRLNGPLISAAELANRIGDPRLRIADVRWYLGDLRRGRDEYAAGHIPGAVFVDLDRDLSAAIGPGRHPLPDPAAFADRLGELGFGDDHAIVVYDTPTAWWRPACGGCWTASGTARWPCSTAGWPPGRRPAASSRRSCPPTCGPALDAAAHWSNTIDREALLADPEAIDLVDVRAPERYRGEVEPVDRVPGHIPGARNRPLASLLDEHGRLLPPDRLQVLLRPTAREPARPQVLACGSGVNACLGILASRVAGLPEPLLYPGSYSDWSAARLPVDTGEEP